MRPRPAAGVIGRDSGDEYLFRSPDGGRIHVLNGTARAIYLLCDGSRTIEDVAAELSARYEVDPPTAGDDVRELVEELLGLGLLAPS